MGFIIVFELVFVNGFSFPSLFKGEGKGEVLW